MRLNSYVIIERAVHEALNEGIVQAQSKNIFKTNDLMDFLGDKVMENLIEVIDFDEQPLERKDWDEKPNKGFKSV